jgi:hypothetical protein
MTTTLIAAIIVGAACVSCFVWAACLKFCNKDKTEGGKKTVSRWLKFWIFIESVRPCDLKKPDNLVK